MAAVRLAREAVDLGLERREAALVAAAERHSLDDPGTDGPLPPPMITGRPHRILVVGPLPDVAARPEGASGRLLPADAAAARDLHDQAGLLADAEVDAILVEPRSSTEDLRAAVGTAVDTGRPVWVMLERGPDDGMDLDELMTLLADAGTARILLPGSDHRTDGPTTPIPPDAWWPDATHLPDAETLDALLIGDTGLLALATDATPATLTPLTEARDRALARSAAMDAAAARDRQTWLREAARRAPGGRALWIGDRPEGLPDGFMWTIAAPDELASAPEAMFRLVATDLSLEPPSLARLLVDRGVVVLEGPAELLGRLVGTGLVPQLVEDRPEGGLRVIARREAR